jgi:hypothetical protein
MPGEAEREDAVEARPDSALAVESFDSVSQRDAARGLGCGGVHPNRAKMRRINLESAADPDAPNVCHLLLCRPAHLVLPLHVSCHLLLVMLVSNSC